MEVDAEAETDIRPPAANSEAAAERVAVAVMDFVSVERFQAAHLGFFRHCFYNLNLECCHLDFAHWPQSQTNTTG